MSTWERYIKDFVSFLKIEKGLAANSIFAYQNDVAKLHDFAISQNLGPTELTYEHLKLFITELYVRAHKLESLVESNNFLDFYWLKTS